MQDSVDPLLRPWKLGAAIFGMGGILALLVAALGLYSVMSYAVTQRTHEMGVRIALGASSRNIVSLVMRESLAMATVGLVAGLLAALYAGRYVRDLLFNTSPYDPVVIGTAAAVLLLTASAASLLPAMRARGVDPIRSLRSD
jgi:ABC-type antimicrobial peptide transport system permease subunit